MSHGRTGTARGGGRCGLTGQLDWQPSPGPVLRSRDRRTTPEYLTVETNAAEDIFPTIIHST